MVKILTLIATFFLLPGMSLLALVVVATPSNGHCAAQATQPSGGEALAPEKPAESKRVVFPLARGVWVRTSTFGPRTDPISGESRVHTGLDLAAPDGTPIMAVADGHVTFAGIDGGWGGLITIEHTIGGQTVATAYVHMWAHGIHVSAGDRVTAGQHIADVGSSGWSTGPHLHLEVRPGGSQAAAIDPEPWLAEHGATDLSGIGTEAPGTAGCDIPPGPDDGEEDAGDSPARNKSEEAS